MSNPIVGQSGVQGGSGTVSATTQRTVLATDVALPAGTNAIGKLAANDGVDVGDVTINNSSGGSAVNVQDGGNSLTVDQATAASFNATVVGTGVFQVQAVINQGAFTIAKAEDAASSTAEVGVPAMAIRKASPANTSDTDGDYEMLQMSAGRLWTSTTVTGSPAVTLAAGAAAIAKAEDVASADADVGVPAMAIRKASPANTSDTDGDYEMLQMSAGRLWTSSTIDAALPAGTNAIGKLAANSGVIIGDVNIVSNIPGTGATSLGKAEDVAHVSGDTGVAVWQIRDDTLNATSGTEGDYEAFHSDPNGATWVHPTDNIAHDDADAGNGIKIAAKAVATTSTQTLVTANDRTHLYADLDGTQLARNQVPLGDLLSERVSDTGGTSTAFSTFDNAAGKRNYITSVTVYNAHATTNGYVDLRDGTAGSILWTFPLPATAGATHNFNPPLRQFTAATALAYDVSAAITTVYISINGFKSKL